MIAPVPVDLDSTSDDRSGINWARWFVLIALGFGLAFVFALPPGVTGDEPNHMLRVSTMADGWIIPPLTKAHPENYRLDGCLSGYTWITLNSPNEAFAKRFTNPACGPSVNARDAQFGGISRAEVYTLVPYLPAVVGYRIGRAINGASGSWYGARLVQLMAWVALVALAIKWIPWGKPFLFALALMPVLAEGAAGITADTMTIASAFLAVALTLRLIAQAYSSRVRASTGELLALVGVFTVLGLCKSVYAPMALLPLTIPASVFGSLRRKLIWVAGTLLLVAATAGAWMVFVVNHIGYAPNNSSNRVAESIAADPWSFLTSILRTWTTPHPFMTTIGGVVALVYPHGGKPAVGSLLALIVLTVLLVVRWLDPLPFRRSKLEEVSDATAGKPDGRAVQSGRDRALSIALVIAVAVVATLAVEYGVALSGFQYTGRYLYGIQGRYFIPLMPMTLIGINVSRYRRPHRWSVAWVPFASAGLVTWWFIANVQFYNNWF